jgi:hypothetical protein
LHTFTEAHGSLYPHEAQRLGYAQCGILKSSDLISLQAEPKLLLVLNLLKNSPKQSFGGLKGFRVAQLPAPHCV